jgi:ABC-2 type transport system permease protein
MSAFAGTLALARLALRRDRIQLPVWSLSLTAILAANSAGNLSLYDTPAERTTQATLEAGTAVSLVFNGPALGTSRGAVTFVESFALVSVLTALMNTLAVVRHTRQNEENGRAEMVGSMVVGRYAGLTAALLVAAGTDLVLGTLATLVLVAIGLPAGGSVAAGAGLTGIGISFAAVAAVSAQVSAFARGANALAGCAIGSAFLLRAAGDTYGTVSPDGVAVNSAWPSWLSPFGWSQQVRPYAEDRWWVLVLPVALATALIAAAFALVGRRDFGQGLIYARPGPARASRALLSPLGVAWRLQRGTLLGWLVGVSLVGIGVGAIGDTIGTLLSASQQVRRIFEQLGGGDNLVDAYFATTMSLVGIAVTAYAVQSLLRMRDEETGPLESVLATAVSRPRWMLSHVVCALAGIVGLLVSAGACTSVSYAVATGNSHAVWRVILAALVQIPACLSLAGFAVAAVGLVPRLSVALSWMALAVCLVIRQLGQPMRLPQVVLNLSPYTHTPAVPSVPVVVTPLVVITTAAAALLMCGLVSFRHRNLSL